MKVLLLRFGELYLKGNNRNVFESVLINNIKKALAGHNFKFEKTFGRYIISSYPENEESTLIEKLGRVFGLYSLSPAIEEEASVEAISNVIDGIDVADRSFKVFVKRADKTFPISSMEFAKDLGERLLNSCQNASVDLYNPQVEIHVDIRMNKKAYIFTESIKCQGGLPLGVSGRGLLLLSGGIDSPVAGYLVGKRGMEFECLHFHSYPYTSELARDKVLTLAQKMGAYVGKLKIHIVSFTKVQEAIHANCSPEFMITIMRRIMMRIAERLCVKNSLGAIVTGESLGQVASQTMQSMMATGEVVERMPIFRPCITMDKEEIIKIAQEIDTYQTSVLPYEDCCTVFLPKNPVIRPTIERCEREEKKLDVNALVEECVNSEEIVEIG